MPRHPIIRRGPLLLSLAAVCALALLLLVCIADSTAAAESHAHHHAATTTTPGHAHPSSAHRGPALQQHDTHDGDGLGQQQQQDRPAMSAAEDGASVSDDADGHGVHDGMPMFFTSRPYSGPLLFRWVDLSSSRSYFLFALLLVLACVGREWLAVYRMELETANREAAAIARAAALHASPDSSIPSRGDRRVCCGMLSAHTFASLLHAVNMALAYGIMVSRMKCTLLAALTLPQRFA
jgi:hypothetical protein